MKIEKCVVSIFVTILTVFGVYLTGYADVTPVSERTPQVRDAIVAAVPGVNNAADVTAAHLAAITSLNLWNSGITELKSDDFSGMTALTWLNLFRNQLSSLPSGIFAGMSLTTIKLGRNTVDPLPLTVSLEQVTEGVFKAVAPTGALFNIVLPITVTNGSITGGATTLTIPRGSVESSTLTVTPTAGTTADVTVDIGTLPSIPSGHNGYVLVKSGNLPLTVTSGSNTAPVFTEGIRARRTVAENTPAGTNIGTPVAATDADNDMLTYSLGWLEGSPVFSIDRHTGQLRTKAPLDYETKNSYSFSVFADDGKGDRVVIIVTINVTDVSETLANNPSTNSAPEFTEGTSATRSVTENTASGTNIGSAVSATDADNDTLTYSLSGTDASSFSIVSTSGQLQTSGVLDYQTKNSYFVTVSVSDGNGGSDSITVTINVTDVSEPEPEPEPEDEEEDEPEPEEKDEDDEEDEDEDPYADTIADCEAKGGTIYWATSTIDGVETKIPICVRPPTRQELCEELGGTWCDEAGEAPSYPKNVLLLDRITLEQLDPAMLEAQLDIWLAESDGSALYLRSIALLESVLATRHPDKTHLLPNYPNPFNPETWIPYHLANPSEVQITIYDTRGTVVRHLDLGHQQGGYYTSRSRAAYWDGCNDIGEKVSSGIYFYQLQTDKTSLLRKMVILK